MTYHAVLADNMDDKISEFVSFLYLKENVMGSLILLFIP
jgi:hypothetical protein